MDNLNASNKLLKCSNCQKNVFKCDRELKRMNNNIYLLNKMNNENYLCDDCYFEKKKKTIINIGKYKNNNISIEELIKLDPEYIEWIIKNFKYKDNYIYLAIKFVNEKLNKQINKINNKLNLLNNKFNNGLNNELNYGSNNGLKTNRLNYGLNNTYI